MRRVGVVALSLLAAVVAAAVLHRALWGYVLEPPFLAPHCDGAWRGSISTPKGSQPITTSALPHEFDRLLARLRPAATDLDPSLLEVFSLVEEDSSARVCTALTCDLPRQYLVSCLAPIDHGSNRYRFSEALFSARLAEIKRAPNWYSEVSGLEFLTLPALTGIFCVCALGMVVGWAMFRAQCLPK